MQKNQKVLKFDKFLTVAAECLGGIRGPGLTLLREKQNGGGDLGNTIVHAMHPSLLGDGLDRMNETMIDYLKTSIDELGINQGQPIDLHLWCRHAITIASTDAVYGEMNPYKDPKIEEAFW
jgi:hypothetical protein